jgi:hypothetical protein
MGANWYCRTEPDNMFELPKPSLDKVERFKAGYLKQGE